MITSLEGMENDQSLQNLRAAWAGCCIRRTGFYLRDGNKQFVSSLFTKALRSAWDAHRSLVVRRPETLTAKVFAGAVNLLPAVKAARLAAIDTELPAREFSDGPTSWSRRLSLRAERAVGSVREAQ